VGAASRSLLVLSSQDTIRSFARILNGELEGYWLFALLWRPQRVMLAASPQSRSLQMSRAGSPSHLAHRLQERMAPPASCHYPFQLILASLPVWEHAIEELEECGTVMRLGNMAEFMGDDVVDPIHRRLDEATIKE